MPNAADFRRAQNKWPVHLRSGRTALFTLALVCACGQESPTDASGSPVAPAADAAQAENTGSAAGDAGSASTLAPANTGASSAAAASAPTCARADLTITRSIPTVWLLIDGSGSMGDGFAGLIGTSRWTVLRDALMDPARGLVARLTKSVAFGLMVYDGGLSPPGVYVEGLCPRVTVVEPGTDNLGGLSDAYPQVQTGASTPTHYALQDLSARIQKAGPNPLGPTYVILATDGKPNLCDFHDGIPASEATENEAVTTVAQLNAQGTKTFAISMTNGDAALDAHLNALALAGGTGQGAFSPTSQDALVAALGTIVGGTTSCEIKVDGKLVKGRECAGEVSLNGQKLACNGPDGYRVKEDLQTLTLLGAACSTLQLQPMATLKASFACDDVILR
ncbi:MAG: hypothetical protein RL385_2701 [Pseudomonadota bacterium]|jgi:hypothetical protein